MFKGMPPVLLPPYGLARIQRLGANWLPIGCWLYGAIWYLGVYEDMGFICGLVFGVNRYWRTRLVYLLRNSVCGYGASL